MTPSPSSAASVLAGLKDFQRATVNHVFRRMYLDATPAHRFLVADEVGLGKTKVAAGVIAKTIEHLRGTVERIDVIYICSNSDIARQNLNSLSVPGIAATPATRITLLPRELHKLQTGHMANLIALTPGTSFDQSSGAGRADERALLYWLCQRAWNFDDYIASRNVFRVDSGLDSFTREVDAVQRQSDLGEIHEGSVTAFKQALKTAGPGGANSFRRRFDRLASEFGRTREMRNAPMELRQEARGFMGELRNLLARTCLGLLEPDLIILDEFQRFKHLLGESDADEVQLAQDLFNYQNEVSKTRVLLLSATPYKMYTLPGEAAQTGDDHYADFHATLSFLFDGLPDATNRKAELGHTLGRFRKALYPFTSNSLSECASMRRALELQLRQVMVRTERLAASADRSGMLVERALPAMQLRVDDVLAYEGLQRAGALVDTGDAFEYWKSAPYALNFMDSKNYLFKRKVMQADPEIRRSLRGVLRECTMLGMPWQDVAGYRRLDPPNARMRSVVQDVIDDRKLWQLLWLPPSLPYTQPAGPYAAMDPASTTKRLLFSSWKLVPRAIATVLSYEAEREMMRLSDASVLNTAEAREERRPLLTFRRSEGQLASMNLMALYYPSAALALLCDPLEAARQKSGGITVRDLVSHFETVITAALAQIGISHQVTATGKADEAWYWAAPTLLDLALHPKSTRAWLDQPGLAAAWLGERDSEEDSAWHEHVTQFQNSLRSGVKTLGPVPADLPQVLAWLALAGPGTCMLRAFARAGNRMDASGMTPAMRTAAGSAGLALRSLFNQPESVSLVRGLCTESTLPYWQQTLRYSADGNLQAMLDEYAHVLSETLGGAGDEATTRQAMHFRSVLMMRAATNRIDRMAPEDAGAERPGQVPMRLRFAMRYGSDAAEDDPGFRADVVRNAFNSPFHPFVLATTSVGQEGLDFHRYCHAIIHWNLPSNPVDMEQREGRIHRYKGHAVRKNIALTYGLGSVAERAQDPWSQLFTRAVRDRAVGQSDITPFWVYAPEGGSRIERYVPTLPLSRDPIHYSDLKHGLAAYRMVFGQSRQEELLHYLSSRVAPDQLRDVVELLSINLEPDHDV